MSPTDDWNHMELVESNSSSDNVARSSPLPPPPPPQPEVPLCLMSLPFRKDCNWRRSIGGWGQEQSDRHFQKSTCGIRGGNGFAAKHSITRNYNNSTLEDGLFHFIMRFPLSCLLMGAGAEGHHEQQQGLCETDTSSLIWMLSFFFLLCPAGVWAHGQWFFPPRFDSSVFTRIKCRSPV